MTWLPLACVPSVANWDLPAFEAEYPGLTQFRGHRLADATPYFAPAADGVVLFLCRWPTEAAIALALPPDATDEELVALRAAVGAWQEAGIGVRFQEVSQERAQLVIRFVKGGVAQRRPGSSATTSADCMLPAESGGDRGASVVRAGLVRAEVVLARHNTDVIGQAVPLSQDELAGTALHELGHALGYPGHAAGSRSVMVRSVDQVRRLGRRLMSDKSSVFHVPTLGALYAVPSGAVVGHLEVSPQNMAPVLQLAGLASRAGWGGPFARVGDRAARFWWLDDDGRVAGFWVVGIERGFTPDAVWIPTPAARQHLAALDRAGSG